MGSVSPTRVGSGMLDWQRMAEGPVPVPGLAFKRTTPPFFGSGPQAAKD